MRKYLFGLIVLFVLGCSLKQKENRSKVIILQPFGNFSKVMSTIVMNKILEINPNVEIRNNTPLPSIAFYEERKRYRADLLIECLRQTVGDDTVVVGLTEKDISTTKGKYKDWGVMGLGFRPGNACVVSSYRLENDTKEQLFKVVLHELGHTEGLPHCEVNTCFMRDAEGGNPIDNEIEFCKKCKTYLIKRGWHLN